MLSITTYPSEYFESCRASMNTQLTAYRELARVVQGNAAEAAKLSKFEPVFFNNLVLVLDRYFIQRAKKVEAENGEIFQEFRLITKSLLLNGGVMLSESLDSKAVTYRPEHSLLHLPVGKPIGLTEPEFTKLARAFFAAVEEKFVP